MNYHIKISDDSRIDGREWMYPIYQLIEAINIQEIYAKSIWNDWNNSNYAPFIFEFENGLRILIRIQSLYMNHREGKRELEIKILRKDFNRNQIVPPFSGKGIIFKRKNRIGKTENTVLIQLYSFKNPIKKDSYHIEHYSYCNSSSEFFILFLIHEIFHCYQLNVMKNVNLGNIKELKINPISRLESSILFKTANESDEDKMVKYLKCYLELKRKKFLDYSTEEIHSEKILETIEGTASYNELMILKLIKKSYTPGISLQDDPWFREFSHIDYYITNWNNKFKKLKRNNTDIYYYHYFNGAALSLILDKLYPPWKTDFFYHGKTLYDEIYNLLF